MGVGERAWFSLLFRAKEATLAGEYTVHLHPRTANRSFFPDEGEAQARVRVRAARGWFWPAAFTASLLAAAPRAIETLGELRLG